MKVRLLLTALLVAGAGTLAGCVVYPGPVGVGVAVEPSVVVRPAPYYYGPRYREYRYYDHRPYRRW
jgi:hypothetical protein